MQESITKGDVLQRLAGASWIVGAVLLVVFNVLHPRTDDPADVGQLVQKIAEANGGFWELDHFLLSVGLWAFMIGAAGVYRSITTGGAAHWARLGFYGIIVGTVLWTVLFALDGLGLAGVIADWEGATGPTKDTLFVIALSLARTNFGLFAMTVVVYWLALTFLAIGIVLSPVYPKWFGWTLATLGVVTIVVVGLPQIFAGASQLITNVLFSLLSVLSTLWGLTVGIWVARRAW